MGKVIQSFGPAIAGVFALVSSQVNARIHLFAAIMVVFLGFLLQVSSLEWALLVICIGMVVMAEALNTAIELLADAAVPEHHPLVGKAKDVAAGAVLLASITAAVVGTIIFLPRILKIL
jgi:diacylglycerol kinase